MMIYFICYLIFTILWNLGVFCIIEVHDLNSFIEMNKQFLLLSIPYVIIYAVHEIATCIVASKRMRDMINDAEKKLRTIEKFNKYIDEGNEV